MKTKTELEPESTADASPPLKRIVIHVFATDNEDEQYWNHNDWFYALKKIVNGNFVRFGKLYRSRSAASRAAGKIGKVEHWYPI